MQFKKIALNLLKEPGDVVDFWNPDIARNRGTTYKKAAVSLPHLRQVRNNLPFEIEIIVPDRVRYGYLIRRIS